MIDEHPGTPWQFLASVELNSKLGWEWHEATMQVADNKMGNNPNSPDFAPEEEAKRQERRKRQQKMAKSRPKL